MPIDPAQVNWLYVLLYAVFVFFASLIGHGLTFNSKTIGALLTTILFSAMFVAWHYYPHGINVGLPVGLPPVSTPATAG
ncbi:MAG: hypothetical protein RLZ98_163 [Pseudomonadota bacterium]|jgi:hypothetical protein